jgi:hypothetical protein
LLGNAAVNPSQGDCSEWRARSSARE